ncbi:hypothetical protein N9937_02325 [bacterium]|nr:hypothetical protein [bacterium]
MNQPEAMTAPYTPTWQSNMTSTMEAMNMSAIIGDHHSMGHPPAHRDEKEEDPVWKGSLTANDSYKEDKGSHYRYSFKAKIDKEDLLNGYVEVNLDPYRVCEVYGVGGGAREHIVKKALRGVDKGHTTKELLDELQCCLDRWKQMEEEKVG